MDIKGEIHSNTVIVGNFNTPLPSIDRSFKNKINKGLMALYDTLGQMDLIDVFRAFHPKATEYTFSSSAHGTFFRTDHMLGHEISFNKLNKIEIIISIFSTIMV